MRVAIFSDVHGNLPALELMVKNAGLVDQYICLGDVVNYGPWSNECVQYLNSLEKCIKIKGNHEEYFLSGCYNGKNELVKKFFDFCITDFTEQEFVKEYLSSYVLDHYYLCHTFNNRYVFRDSKISLNRNYITGHTHRQFKLESNGFILFNTGSVGQNREFLNRINYIIYNSLENSFDLRSLVYNVDTLINEMKIRGYPEICIDYYMSRINRG